MRRLCAACRDHGLEVLALDRHRQRRRLQLREVEDVVDEQQHALGVRVRDRQQLDLLLVVLEVALVEQQLERALDRRERRPRLVRDDGDELGLQPVEALRVLEQLRVADLHRDLRGEQRKELLVVRAEARRARRARPARPAPACPARSGTASSDSAVPVHAGHGEPRGAGPALAHGRAGRSAHIPTGPLPSSTCGRASPGTPGSTPCAATARYSAVSSLCRYTTAPGRP